MLAKDRPWRGYSAIQVALAVGYGKQRLKLPEASEANERWGPHRAAGRLCVRAQVLLLVRGWWWWWW